MELLKPVPLSELQVTCTMVRPGKRVRIIGASVTHDDVEAYPYDDGNGRTARAAMGAEMSAVGQSRIIIPTVFRNEYLTGVRALSRDGRCDLYVRMLAFAWRWTADMPWHDRAAVEGQLIATNALVDSTDAERSGLRLNLP